MNKLVLLIAIVFSIHNCIAQNVTTILDSAGHNITDAIILDEDNNLYGSDYLGNSIFKLTPEGVVSYFASGFNTPNGLAFDSDKNLFVCDHQGNRIYKLDVSGNFIDTFIVSNPSGIIKQYGSDTMIYTRYDANEIGKLAPDGTIIPWHTGLPLDGPVGLAYNDAGQLFVGNFNNRQIFKVFPDALVYVATVPGPPAGWLGFIAYARGVLWGTSVTEHKIYKIYPELIDSVEYYAGHSIGSVDGSVDSALFNQPNGIIGSVTGDTLYVSDLGTGQLRIITEPSVSGLELPEMHFTIEVHPNPSSGLYNLSLPIEARAETLQIMDVDGRIIKEKPLSNTTKVLVNLEDAPAGVYFARISLTDGRRSSVRLIKQ